MTTISIEEAQAKLPELIASLHAGEEILITRDDQPVARLHRERPEQHKPRQPGSAQGMLVILAEDNEHLQDFTEYMP